MTETDAVIGRIEWRRFRTCNTGLQTDGHSKDQTWWWESQEADFFIQCISHFPIIHLSLLHIRFILWSSIDDSQA